MSVNNGPGPVTNDLLLNRIESLAERFEDVSSKIGDLYGVIYEGKGRPSMLTEIATISHRVGVLESSEKDRKLPTAVWLPMLLSLVVSLTALLIPLIHKG